MLYACTRERSGMYVELWIFRNDFHNSPNLQLFLIFLSGLVYYSCLLNSSIIVITSVSFCNVIKNGILYNMIFSNTKRNLLCAIEIN